MNTHIHTPYGKDGTGYYTKNALTNYDIGAGAMELVLEAVNVVKPVTIFTIVEYGCADGGISMPIMYACVKAVREKYGKELPVQVIYEDLAVNDFKSLFLRLQGHNPGTPNFHSDFPNVFVTACATNFFNQCVPSSSVTLGYSSTAMHWLRDKPCDITGSISATMITVKEEIEAFRKQAERDWETILLKRASELITGGRLVLVEFAKDKEVQSTGRIKETKVFTRANLLTSIWQGLVDDNIITQVVLLSGLQGEFSGEITKEEFLKTNVIGYWRTVEEFEKPFKSQNSRVRKAGLHLVSIATKTVSCAYRKQWLKEKGDPTEYARRYVANIRRWSNATFMSGLSDSREIEEKAHIVDELFKRCEAEVAKCPEDHGEDNIHAYMVIEKTEL